MPKAGISCKPKNASGQKTSFSKKTGKLLEIMPFGKYKGNRIEDIPADYKQWMLNKFDWTPANDNLRRAIMTGINV
jgi:hypothetical protein